MKYLVNFISNFNRSENKKKSYYELIVCDSHEADVSGMITLNNCLVVDKVSYHESSFSSTRSMFSWPNYRYVSYSYSEEQIIVNREDIDNIKTINDCEVSNYVPKFTKEEAETEAKRLTEESEKKYKKDKKEYEDSLEKKNDSKNKVSDVSDVRNWLIKTKNQIEDFLQRSLK